MGTFDRFPKFLSFILHQLFRIFIHSIYIHFQSTFNHNGLCETCIITEFCKLIVYTTLYIQIDNLRVFLWSSHN